MMNNKLLRAVIFLFILFLGIEFIVFPGNAFFAYKKAYQRTMLGIKGREVQVLFLGDSHAAVISPDMLNVLTYNLSYSADTTREMYLKMLYVLEESHGLKYLFLQADPHILCKYRFTAENKSFIKGIVPNSEYNSVYAKGQKQFFAQGFLDHFPIFSSDLYVLARKKLLTKITHLFAKEEEKTKSYADESFQERKRDAAHRCEDHFSSGEDRDMLFYYQKIIVLCKQHGVHVIGIRYPVSKEYLEDARKLHWSDLAAQIDGSGFERMLDYSGFFTEPGYFENTDHINSKSAKILLEQIRKDFPAIKNLNK